MSGSALTASPAREFESSVLSVTEESARIRSLTLSVDADFAFLPGMWVMLHCPEDPKLSAAYSMCSSPLEKGSIEICFNRVGPLTERMFALKPGDTLRLKGPFGKWVYREDASHDVMISEGTGLSPFRSMVRYALDRKLPAKLTLLYAAASVEDLPFRSDLESFSKRGVHVRTKIKEREGTVTIDDVAAEVPKLSEAAYYLCGPSSLVKTLSAALIERGVHTDHVRYEKWGDY